MVRRVTAAVRLLSGDKEPVRLASTGNLALAKLLTVDGVVTEPGDRVLVKDQTNAAENGIYTASERAWSRATDSSSSQVMIAGMKVYVQEGSTHAGSTWVLATDRPNFRTDSIQYDLYLSTNVISTVEAAASAANSDAAAAAASAATATAAAISILGATSPPPPSSFKALAIKTASTTTISVVAEFVVVTDGTSFKTVAINAILNIGLAGLVNRLDTGSLAPATWYSIWAIAKPDGTSGVLASASSTSPTLPTGYTYKARIGWARTTDGAATLYGIYQLWALQFIDRDGADYFRCRSHGRADHKSRVHRVSCPGELKYLCGIERNRQSLHWRARLGGQSLMATIPRNIQRRPAPPAVRTYTIEQMIAFGWLTPFPIDQVGPVPRTPDPRIPNGPDPRIPRKDD